MLLGLEIGSWADVISSFAALASTILAIMALGIAKAANRTADRVRVEAKEQADRQTKLDQERDQRARELQTCTEERELERDRREDERDRRRIAEGVAAWWVIKDETKKWGVFISNAPSTPTIFHSLTIETRGNDYQNEILVKTLTPALFFAVSTKEGWKFPEKVDNTAGFSPVLNSLKHSIEALDFTDQLGTRWKWSKDTGVDRMVGTL